MHVAFIWQRFLPYHLARLRRAEERLSALGWKVTGIEVASRDRAYGFPPQPDEVSFRRLCAFPDRVYHDLKADDVLASVLAVLKAEHPDVVFAPATPFPEGMAALRYALSSGSRAVLMDDAWELTDHRRWPTKLVKRVLHKGYHAALVPAPSHRGYYRDLGFDGDRITYGVDAVDNAFFGASASEAHRAADEWRSRLGLPERYFLYVGRSLPRKGLPVLLKAYGLYRGRRADAWPLLLVGAEVGPDAGTFIEGAGVTVKPPLFGEDLAGVLGLSEAVIVPSLEDPWALAINEAMACGRLVLASDGCGATGTLIRDGENGWRYPRQSAEALARLMHRVTLLSPEARGAMGRRAREAVEDWGLDRFVDGVAQAAGLAAGLATGPAVPWTTRAVARAWRGRVRVT